MDSRIEALAAVISRARFSALVMVSPSWRQAVADAAEMDNFRAWVKETGWPQGRAERVLGLAMSRSGTVPVKTRLADARSWLAQGAPYDATNSAFNTAAVLNRSGSMTAGDAHTGMVRVYDSGVFAPCSLDHRDIFDDE